MPSQQYPITDSELLGILSENVIDELQIFPDDDFDFVFVEENVNIQADYVSPSESWLPGNPICDSIEFPFLKTPGLKEDIGDEPISYFNALCTSELLELIKD